MENENRVKPQPIMASMARIADPQISSQTRSRIRFLFPMAIQIQQGSFLPQPGLLIKPIHAIEILHRHAEQIDAQFLNKKAPVLPFGDISCPVISNSFQESIKRFCNDVDFIRLVVPPPDSATFSKKKSIPAPIGGNRDCLFTVDFPGKGSCFHRTSKLFCAADPIAVMDGHTRNGIRLFKERTQVARECESCKALEFCQRLRRCRRIKPRALLPVATRTRNCEGEFAKSRQRYVN